MVHWVYVIECEDDYIYVGETTRLYRRMNEHQSGGGSVNTGRHKPKYLDALYKVADNYSFFIYRSSIINGFYNKEAIDTWGEDDGDHLLIENHFTELFMFLRGREDDNIILNDGCWNKVRGGKYTKYANEFERNPTSNMKEEDIVDRPSCNCGCPAEVKISRDKNCIYFVCALKNAWKDFSPGLDYAESCDFYKVYKDDVYIKKQHEINMLRLRESWCENLPTAFDCCIKCKDIQYTMVFSRGKRRQICEKCFGNHYEELKKEYNDSKCLIMDD